MISDNWHISLGISPNSDGIVIQPFVLDGFNARHRPCFAFIIAFADLERRGYAGAIDLVGAVLLNVMSAFFPLIEREAASLIPKGQRQLDVILPDHSGSKRALHLRVYTVNEDRSIAIRRFNNDDEIGGDRASVLLDPLLAAGPQAATDFVGAMVLAELADMHPDAIAPYPAIAEQAHLVDPPSVLDECDLLAKGG